MTGGRIKRIAPYLDGDDFCLTYGDGVSDVNIQELLDFHRSHGKLATLTATPPPARFGALRVLADGTVDSFVEKPEGDGALINGGFFVVNPSALDLIDGDDTVWEREPLERLAQTGNLSAFRHSGFWQPMDTLRDKTLLEKLWSEGKAPWKVWK
jgi:glucose-1-phosphate cytidylyltransferase